MSFIRIVVVSIFISCRLRWGRDVRFAVGICRDVEVVSISRFRDCVISEVMVFSAVNRTKRTASDGCDVI